MVMKKAIVIGVIMLNLLLGNWAKAGVSLVRNGSFEDDGQIADITAEAPRNWCDVNIPSDKFGGKVSTTWKTEGNYSLFFYVKKVDTYAGDMAMISQQVNLTDVLGDVNQIIFDIKLSDPLGNEWDLEKRTALVLIDDVVVWDSNGLGPSANGDGEYLDLWIDVGTYDANLHKLTLAIKINEDIPTPGLPYWAQWDFVKFDKYCGGFGYLPEDLNYDCYVDMLDLKMLAGQWLVEAPDEKYDLFQDGIVNFYDFVFFAEYWMTNSDSNNWGDDNCYEVELLAGDINDSGEVDLSDVSVLAGVWLGAADCSTRADINDDGAVDFRDFAVLAGQWRQKSWLYWLN